MRLQLRGSSRFPVFCLAVAAVCSLGASAFALDAPHNATNSIGCNNCHATHGFFGIMPRGQLQSDQCKTCHKVDGQASTMANVGDHMHGNAVTDYGIDCGACHDPHSAMDSTDTHGGGTATNIKLLRSDPKKYVTAALDQLVFQTSPAHFAFDSAPYNGVCQTCHTDVTTRPSTPWHKNNGTGVSHHIGEGCTGCHPHGDSFKASGGTCKECHSSPKGALGHRRQIVQSGGTGGDFSGSGGGPVTATVRDLFATVSYANNDGTASWVANWVDSEDTDPAAGNVQIVSGELRLSGGGDLTLDTVLDQFSAQLYSNNDGTASWATDWLDSEADGPTAGNVQVAGGQLQMSGGSGPSTDTVRDEFTTALYSNNDGTANWAADWIDSEGDGPTAGNILITGGQLRVSALGGDTTATVRDEFSADLFSNNDGTATWATDWIDSEADGPTAGHVQVSGGQLQVTGGGGSTTATVRDEFTTPSFSNNDGTATWSGDWIDSEGDGPTAGSVQVTGDQLRLNTPAGSAPSWTELAYDNFEGGFGNYTDGGNNCSLYTSSTFAYTPPNAVELQDASGDRSSFWLTNGIDAVTPGYAQLRIQFWYRAEAMQAGDTFLLQYDNGTGYQTVKTYAWNGSTFANGQFYSDSVVMDAGSYTFTTDMRIRFQCVSGKNRYVYIDEVRIEGYDEGGVGTPPDVAREADLSGGVTTATLTFDYSSANAEAGDDVVVEVSANGGTDYTPLETIAGGGAGSKSYPITAYAASNTRVRFSITSGYDVAGEYFYADNVQISYTTPNPTATPDVAREADLSGGVSSATLTFNYSSANAEAGDDIFVEMSDNGGVGYTVIDTIAGGGTGSKNYDILTYAASNTRVRFRVSTGYDAGDEYFYADNVQIEYVTPAGAPPDVAREADLSGGVTSAAFTFDYSAANAETGDDIIVEVSNNGGGSYTPLETIAGGGTGSKNYNILTYAASNTRVRFRISSGYDAADEYFYVDNVQVEYGTPNPSATPSVAREASIPADIISATFSYDYRNVNAEAGDVLIVEVDNGGGYVTLETVTGAGTGPSSHDFIAYAGTNTTIRFRVSSGYDVFDEYFYVDNVQIAYQTPGAGASDSFHVADGTGNEIVTDDDCIVCHDQSGPHQSLASPTVKLNDPDGGTAILYSGTGGSIEAFCVNCHDADSATAFGVQPFSDGKTPTDIGTGWASSAHNAALTTEACLSCHGGTDSTRTGEAYDRNAHGSASTMAILSPTIASETPANAQEALCYACHDTDGPAGSNIESAFAATTRHLITDGEQAGNGRDVECATCHVTHAAQASVAGRNSNAASGGIVGVSGADASGNPVSSISFEYELCFKCHSTYAGAGSNPGDGGPDPNVDKAAQFATTHETFHPVRGTQNNANCNATTMEAPWDNTHRTMWCSDCHEGETTKGPHGSSQGSILKASLSAAELAPGDGKWYTPLCVKCHKYSVYVDGATGSRFTAHNNNNHRHPDWSGGYGGCLSCHYDTYFRSGLTDHVRMPNVHGGDDGGDVGADTGWGLHEPAAYVNGSRIVQITMGRNSPECTVVAAGAGAGDSGCGGHTKSY